jgi:acyl carrier protein
MLRVIGSKMSEVLRLEIDEKIKNILGDELAVSPSVLSTVKSSTPLLGRGVGLDSVETMALVLSIEAEFGISVPDTDMTATLFETIGTLTDYVLHKLSESKDGEV